MAAKVRVDAGLVHHPHHRDPADDQADHDREAVAAADEVLGAVDRVDEPDPVGAEPGQVVLELLADHHVGREGRVQAGDDQRRGVAVSRGDRLVTGLVLDHQAGGAGGHHQGTGPLGQGGRLRQPSRRSAGRSCPPGRRGCCRRG
jgi:hypothetical protein